jgi:SnoaL-like polyketide cyclase
VSNGRRTNPDLHIKIDDQIAEDDRVVVRWRATGTRVVIPGQQPAPVARLAGVSIVRLIAGKQVDARTEWATIVGDAIREHDGALKGRSPG